MNLTKARPSNVVVSGSLCSGKTTLANGLRQEMGYSVISARDVLRALAPNPLNSRKDLQAFGLATDLATQSAWLGEAVTLARTTTSVQLVVDSARTSGQVRAVRRALPGEPTLHVHLAADVGELRRRFRCRADSEDAAAHSLEEAMRHPAENEDPTLERIAEMVIDTTRLAQHEVLEHVLAQVLASN
jgi:adenylosuccinate synthase